ncbi:cilia- and flagella-associated 99 [Brachionus plicatilis]|uniref:Cilia-and flagella-associated 99 n=1 Tax=Brachionus plicatilis TaxID=10195 RepID=A0A3M7SH05_BRAPC|nr:cilia- and flagella-associated 99 [Brachionus plicatilis]
MSSDIVSICLGLLDKYDTKFSPEAYLQRIENFQSFGELEKRFVLEIFYGCYDRKSILDIVVNGYYSKDGKNCLQSDRSLYTFVAYMILYHIKYYGIEYLYILSSYPNQEKIFKFLKYFLNEKNLITWLSDAWSTLLDKTFVEENLLNPLLKLLPDLNLFLKELEEGIYQVKPRPKQAPTQPRPFNITQPKPRKVLLPEPLPEKEVFKPLKHVTKSANSIASLVKNPNVTYEKKSRIVKRTVSKSANDRYQDHFEEPVPQFKAKPFLNKQNNLEPIKLNTAAVLKDEHLIKKQIDEMMKKFSYLEMGQGSPNEFLKWQTEMRLNDLKVEQEKIEMKKLLSKLTHEEAILAKANLVENKKAQVKQIQHENSLLKKEKEEKEKIENEKVKNIVSTILQDEKKVKQIKEQVVENKKLIAQQVIKESEKYEAEAYKRVEEEMRKKIELIQQIKAAESIPINRTKQVDLTQTQGYGFLNEMSIAELTERLQLAKQENEEYYQKKHDEIIKIKIDKEENLIEKLNFINKYRNEIGNNEKKETFEDLKTKAKEEVKNSDSLAKLKKKIEEKRVERSKVDFITVNKKESKKQINIYANQRKALEKERFKELEKTHERYRFLNLESARLTNIV